MSAQNNAPHPRPKIDRLTLIMYCAVGVFLLLLCLLLGAAMDDSLTNGKIDTGKIGKAISYLLANPGKIFSALTVKGGYAPKMLFFGVIVIGIFALYKYSQDAKRLHRRGTEHGSAKWGDEREKKALRDNQPPQKLPIKKYDAEHPEGYRVFDDNGEFQCVTVDNNILLTKNVYLSLDTWSHKLNLNVLVIGGSGAQKTRGFAKPNIMQLNTSYVITDPKGEILAAEGKLLEAAGYDVRVFNTIDMAHSSNYNPFHYVFDQDGQVSEVKVKSMVETLFSATKGEGEKDDFWSEKGKTLLIAIVFLLLAQSEYSAKIYMNGKKKGLVIPETRDESHLNFSSAAAKLRMMQYPPQGGQKPDGFFLTQNEGETDEDFEARREKAFLCPLDREFLELHRRNTPLGELAFDLYTEVRNAPEETGQSFVSSANVKLANFNLRGLKNLTCCDNIHLETIGDRKTALFVIISATDPTFRFLAALLYSQLFDVLSNRANFVYDGHLPIHVRCIMDEFANCGEIPNFNGIISFVRGMNMSLSVIIQNMSQLKSRYEKTWEEIPGNCDSILFLGGKEESTLKSISEQLGKETIDVKGQNRTRGKSPSTSENNSILGRELLQVNEVGIIPTTDCILMMRGHNPFYEVKYVLEEHPNYRFSGDADKANVYRLDDLHTVTYEEFVQQQAEKQKRIAEQAAAPPKVDTPVNFADSDTERREINEVFFSGGDQVTVIFTPSTFEDILEFGDADFSPEIEDEIYADEEPRFGTVQAEMQHFDLGEPSRPRKEMQKDEAIPPPAVVNADGSIEEPPTGSADSDQVYYGAVPSEIPESFDDLSELEGIEMEGTFTESFADVDIPPPEPDFGQPGFDSFPN